MKRTIEMILMTLLIVSAATFVGITLMGCSSDDEDNNSNELIGIWYLIGYNDGWGHIEDFNEGEIVVTFTKDGEVKIVNKREDQHPLPTSTQTYTLSIIESSIYTHEKRPGISFNGGLIYSYYFIDGMLHISAEAYDGPSYGLKKATNIFN